MNGQQVENQFQLDFVNYVGTGSETPLELYLLAWQNLKVWQELGASLDQIVREHKTLLQKLVMAQHACDHIWTHAPYKISNQTKHTCNRCGRWQIQKNADATIL